MFSPALKPGSYWVEFRYGRSVSPRVKVEIIAMTPAPDEATARKLASDWVRTNDREDWGGITKVEDRGDHWIVIFANIHMPGTTASHPAAVYVFKKTGKIQEILGS